VEPAKGPPHGVGDRCGPGSAGDRSAAPSSMLLLLPSPGPTGREIIAQG